MPSSRLAACLATARQEGLIRHNPAAEATLPYRARIDGEQEERRPLSRGQLAAFLNVVHPDHRLMGVLYGRASVPPTGAHREGLRRVGALPPCSRQVESTKRRRDRGTQPAGDVDST